MQLHQLSYFLAVADTLHFTRAAEQMRVAQPSLSQQIRALERDLGAPLFNRIRGNVSLTDAGQALLPVARRIVADSDAARRAVRELDELDRGRVRLGATPSLCTGLLPAMLAAFRREHPRIELLLTEGGSRDLQTALSEGAIDLAMIIDSRTHDDPRLSMTPLFVEELVVISPADAPDPLSGPRVAIEELQQHPLVMFRRGYDLREATMSACRAAGFTPTFSIEGGEMDAVLGFVAAGLGLAVVPSTVVGERFRRTQFAEPGLTRTVQLAHRRDLEPPRAVRALRSAIEGFLSEQARADGLPPGTTPLPRAKVRAGGPTGAGSPAVSEPARRSGARPSPRTSSRPPG